MEFAVLSKVATLAPSGDNTQPWQITLDLPSRTAVFHIDGTRDISPMNEGQRMARISVGAAVENIAVAAGVNRVGIEIAADAVRIRCDKTGEQTGSLPPKITARVTNRRLYDARTIATGELAELEKTVAGDRVRPGWIGQRDRVCSLAEIIGMADATMFGFKAVRKAFLENVRFDRPAGEEVEDGLSLASLELRSGERLGLGVLGAVPDALYRAMGIGRAMRSKARSLVESCSGLCVITTEGNEPPTDFQVGRRMQQAWLALTERGYAVQPMMSLPVLESMVFHQHPAVTEDVRRRTVELSGEIKKLAGVADNERIAAILRFGFAPPPSGRTGRRPLESVVTFVEERGQPPKYGSGGAPQK
jgi:hypothetical protein